VWTKRPTRSWPAWLDFVIESLGWECWQPGTPLDFRGTSYRYDLMTPFFNLGPIEHPKIPIYIAAVNP